MSHYERDRRIFPKYLIAAFVSFIALVFIVAASLQLLNRVNIHNNGVNAVGTVCRVEHVTNTDTDILAFTVKFSYDKQEYFIENENKSIDPRYQLNEKLRVKFIKDSPEKAIIDDPREQEYGLGFFLPTVIGLAVLSFILYAIKKDKDFSVTRLQNSGN